MLEPLASVAVGWTTDSCLTLDEEEEEEVTAVEDDDELEEVESCSPDCPNPSLSLPPVSSPMLLGRDPVTSASSAVWFLTAPSASLQSSFPGAKALA